MWAAGKEEEDGKGWRSRGAREKDAQKQEEALGRDPESKRRAGPGLFRLFPINERWGKAGGEFR